MRRLWPGRIIFGVFVALLTLAAVGNVSHTGCRAQASDNIPTDFCYRQQLSVTNNTGGAITNYPVRIAFNAATNIGQGNLDSQAWDFVPATSANTEVEVQTQDLSETAAGWWLIVPSLENGATQNFNFYMGNAEAHRDNGMWFSGNDYGSATDHADFDITDNLQIDIGLLNESSSARNQIIAEHRTQTPGEGYRIQFESFVGALNLTFVVDGAVCRLVWDSDWTGEEQDFSFRYASAAGNDAFIDRNGSVAASCDIDQGTIATTTNDFMIGTRANTLDLKLANAVIRDVHVWNAGVSAGHWDFDADNTTEASAVNPNYSGTVSDTSGNSHDLTYTMSRSQTGISHSLGPVELTSAPQVVSFGDETVDLLGDVFGGVDLGDAGDPNPRLPGYSIVQDAAESSGFPVEGFWVLILTFLAVLTFAIVIAAGGPFWLASTGATFWIAIGTAYRVYDPWVIVLWLAVVVLIFGTSKWAESS